MKINNKIKEIEKDKMYRLDEELEKLKKSGRTKISWDEFILLTKKIKKRFGEIK